jgi:hypothetical protein
MGLELYRLTAMFLSAEPIEKISIEARQSGKGLVDSNTHWLEALRSRFFWDEVSRILIYLAIQGRLYLNLKSPFDRSDRMRSLPVWNESCGYLEEISLQPKATKPLVLSEAFNKIIHADVINPDVEAGSCSEMLTAQKINSTVYLRGMHFEKSWRAALDIIEFVRLLRRALRLGGSDV